MGRVPGVFKTGRLLHVDILRQEIMEKRIAHINLTDRPPTGDSNGENQMNGSRLHNWTKGVIIVNTMPLGEATSNETSLVLLNRTIRTMLGFKYPLATNNVCARGTRNQGPCICLRESRELLSHSIVLGWFMKGIMMRHRSRKESTLVRKISNGTIGVCFLPMSVIPEASDHAMMIRLQRIYNF
jgi:hypothetical protein